MTDLLGVAFGILPFSYYEPETAVEILKDCRNKNFDPQKYNYDHVRPKDGKLKAEKSEEKVIGRLRMEPCPCF